MVGVLPEPDLDLDEVVLGGGVPGGEGGCGAGSGVRQRWVGIGGCSRLCPASSTAEVGFRGRRWKNVWIENPTHHGSERRKKDPTHTDRRERQVAAPLGDGRGPWAATPRGGGRPHPSRRARRHS
jgi:hypothetical protein